jgi:carboxyl-terminal processing protease
MNILVLWLNRDDWFSVYINSITARFDPHTYFAQRKKERLMSV